MKGKTGRKLKNIVSLDTRISLYQTAMNNSGRNFAGKKVSVQKMSAFASAFYKLCVKNIENIGELNIQQIEKTLGKPSVKKTIKKSKFKQLMKKGKKKNGGRR